MNTIPQKLLALLFLLVAVVVLLGSWKVEVMEVDTAQYAAMSVEMLQNGEYLQIQHRGGDYLDKPPLIFWLSATAFKWLGITHFVFRLPALLFIFLGIYSTYGLGKILYDRQTGLLAALLLATCQAWLLLSVNVITDTYLDNAVIFGVWKVMAYIKDRRGLDFLLGFSGIAWAMLAKGPIGLMVPVLAFIAAFAYKRSWRMFFQWQWLLAILLILLWLAPMIWGLYQQYGWEGVRFYFWTQSFGRITGENLWKDDSSYLFFTHTFLWAFLPWAFLAVYAVFYRLFRIFREKLKPDPQVELLTLGGFVLPFIALSTSQFKLPHYIFVTFPFAAILTANVIRTVLLTEANRRLYGWFLGIQSFVAIVLFLASIFLAGLIFPLSSAWIWGVGMGCFIASAYFMFRRHDRLIRLLAPSALAVLGINFFLFAHFLPQIMTYQASNALAHYLEAENIPVEEVYSYDATGHGLDFYARYRVPEHEWEEVESAVATGETLLYTSEEGLDLAMEADWRIRILAEFDSFHTSELSAEFLNPATRSKTLEKQYLLLIETGPE